MNPAYSVILFTAASGAGYGLLALLGITGARHGQASSLTFALTSLIVALVLITVGLLSSTLHLGHPERAWRALSQWRSSWLSREGIAAIGAYPVALVFGAVWSGVIAEPRLIAPLGVLTAVMCVITVFCTGKIYSTLTTIRQWHHPLVVPVYLVFALATGAALLATVAYVFDRFQIFQAVLASVALLAVMALKVLYWRSIDASPRSHTIGAATGLGGTVRQWEVPHTNINFIQKEMGFAVARKHVQKLRLLTIALLVLALAAMLLAIIAPVMAALSAFLAIVAAAVERWLFFAEAEHVSQLYYGRQAA